MTQKVPLMIIPAGISKSISRPFLGIGRWLSDFFSGVKYNIEQSDLNEEPERYFANALLNSILFFAIFFILLFLLLFFIKNEQPNSSLLKSSGYSFLIFALVFLIFIKYPRILAGKKAELLEKNLVFALKDLLLQVTSGVSLYNGLVNISKSNYGQVSVEFEKAAKAVNSGKPVEQALEEMTATTSSEFLRRVVWQLVNTLKAGASLEGALRTIIDDLSSEQKSRIRDYARELNLWSLIYMLFAVAIPTIGAVLLIILSSFAGFGISKGIFVSFIAINFALQYVIIGFVKSRRPVVNL